MTRDEIITLAGQLAFSLQDTDTLDLFMNEVFKANGQLDNPPMVEGVIKALTSGTATYSYESDMLRIVHAIMHDEIISEVFEGALDAYNDTWQSDTGTPTQYTQDSITARQYRLYPEPDFSSDALIPINGEPWGEDWPDNSLALFYADDREDNISSIFSIPLAFDALAWEFSYPSEHTDQAFATTARAIAQLFYSLLLVEGK